MRQWRRLVGMKQILVMMAMVVLGGCGEKIDQSFIPNSDLAQPTPTDTETLKPLIEAPKVVVDSDQIEFRGGIIEEDGLAYFEEKLFTGVAVWKFTAPNPKGQKWREITYKDGKQHGLETYYWHVSGQKKSVHTFKDGKEHGPGAAWYENGQKQEEWNFKDRRKHGPYTKWYENGQKQEESTYKDSHLVASTIWKPNGQKCPKTKLANGTGIVFWYHENGQKMHELSYNKGKCVSVKEWDKDGKLQ